LHSLHIDHTLCQEVVVAVSPHIQIPSASCIFALAPAEQPPVWHWEWAARQHTAACSKQMGSITPRVLAAVPRRSLARVGGEHTTPPHIPRFAREGVSRCLVSAKGSCGPYKGSCARLLGRISGSLILIDVRSGLTRSTRLQFHSYSYWPLPVHSTCQLQQTAPSTPGCLQLAIDTLRHSLASYPPPPPHFQYYG
jgi:hypothetical protein